MTATDREVRHAERITALEEGQKTVERYVSDIKRDVDDVKINQATMQETLSYTLIELKGIASEVRETAMFQAKQQQLSADKLLQDKEFNWAVFFT